MDNYKRELFLKNELKRKLLRSIKRSSYTPLSRRYMAAYYMTTLPKYSSQNFSSNRCAVSGRVWSVNKKTKYSRFVFRNEVAKSNIPGCRRAS